MEDLKKPDICIFHGGCDDGFGAAWAVWRRWPDVEFVPGIYGKDPVDVRGKNVWLVDFSYKRPVMEQMCRDAFAVTVIDHHKTAQADLGDLEQWAAMEGFGASVKVIFDMQQSGAVLTWKYCHGIPHNDPPPNMLALIQDRDLWRFAFGNRTKQFSAALRIYPQDFKVWDEISADTDKLITEGETVLRSHQSNISKFLDEVYFERLSGYDVPCVNVPYHYASDVAHELLAKFPDAPFTMTWFKRGDGLFQTSLRSEDHRIDVSEIAKKHGGGGHRNAAGYTSKKDEKLREALKPLSYVFRNLSDEIPDDAPVKITVTETLDDETVARFAEKGMPLTTNRAERVLSFDGVKASDFRRIRDALATGEE